MLNAVVQQDFSCVFGLELNGSISNHEILMRRFSFLRLKGVDSEKLKALH